jgi:capsular exopolysaccharide synthesis family protein
MISQNEPEGLTIKALKSKIINNLKWFVIFAFIGMGLGLLYNRIRTPYYKISSTILIKNDGKGDEFNTIFRDMNIKSSNPMIEDQVGVLKSYNLNFRTMQHLNWRYSWYQENLLKRLDLYGNHPFDVVETSQAHQLENVPVTIIPISDDEFIAKCQKETTINGEKLQVNFEQKIKFTDTLRNQYFQFKLQKRMDQPILHGEEYILVFNNLSQMALVYKDALKIKPVNALNSNLISLELTTSQLNRDVDYLNQLGRVYIQYGLDEKNRIANNTIKFIDDQITGVDQSLQLAGDQFSSFRARNRTVDLGQEASTVVEKLKVIEAERANLDLKLEYYSNLKFYLENRDQNKDLVAPSLVGVTDDALNTKVLKLNELYTKREVLSYTAQEKNPVLISLNNEINYTQKSLRENVENLIANTNVEIQNLNERQRSVNYELSKLPKTEQDLIGIKRNFDLNNELYTFLLQRRAEAEIAKASNNPDALILDPTGSEIAVLLGPKLVLNLIIGLFAGLFTALGMVLFNEVMSDIISDLDDITYRLGVSVIGMIGNNKFSSETPVMKYPRSALTESFRGLRVNLEYVFKSNECKVLAVHSHLSGEGKSFIAVNLALIFAMSRRRVLLIDADLRKPRLHSILNVKNESGLNSFLAGKTSVSELVNSTGIENLDIITSGISSLHSAEYLNQNIVQLMINELRQKYDYIIIDNSPIGIVYDPMIIGGNADFNLILLRINYSRKDEIDSINKLGQEGILKNVMVAINGVKQRKSYGYYTEDTKSNDSDLESDKVRTDEIPNKVLKEEAVEMISKFSVATLIPKFLTRAR